MNSDESIRKVRFPPAAGNCRVTSCSHAQASAYGMCSCWPAATARCETITHPGTLLNGREVQASPILFPFAEVSPGSVVPRAEHVPCRGLSRIHNCKGARAVQDDSQDNAGTPCCFQ